ncbi:MAG: hypothetical protein DI564_09325 [Rhodanobacter denitrificans]|uniref:Uncharacterized protein n=1 Tax=Rhodanobacter denitrificans TaxID=666685 RepID=A0A2W5KKS6_9GAMM|nr:MAG: hypothetical protein DI564_09325 [Rhodanobacter denitrificans]
MSALRAGRWRRIGAAYGRCLRGGIGARLIAAVALATAMSTAAIAAAADTAAWSARDFDHARLGRIQMRMPPSWLTFERQDGAGTTFVRIVPPQERFGLEIQIGTRAALKLATLDDAGLPGYLIASLSGLLPRFLEEAVVPLRFGPEADGVYARLTDRHPRAGEFLFLTRGLRLDGDAVIVFTLYASDHDASVLTPVLAVVSGITITPP